MIAPDPALAIAEFAITQMVFDVDNYLRLRDELARRGSRDLACDREAGVERDEPDAPDDEAERNLQRMERRRLHAAPHAAGNSTSAA
jgi:hypothetical protein